MSDTGQPRCQAPLKLRGMNCDKRHTTGPAAMNFEQLDSAHREAEGLLAFQLTLSVPPELAGDSYTSRRAKQCDSCGLGDWDCLLLLWLNGRGGAFPNLGVFIRRAENPRLSRKQSQYGHQQRESLHGTPLHCSESEEYSVATSGP
jgi:hypothetical protein